MDDSEGDHFLSDEGQRQPDATVFTLNGESIPIHLHHSLGSGGRNAMAKKIEHAGGNPYATEDEARVIICRYNTPIYKQLEFHYDHDRYKWVEPPSWVDTCIMTGKYEHYLPGRTDMSERRVNSNSRNPFSSDDDEYLVKFLAHRIPFKESGGRSGNGVYKDLCSDQRASRYPWAARHTWQSWRDRYTKNQNIFDPRIAYAVRHQRDPPAKPGAKGQYMIPRRARRPQFLRHTVQDDEEDGHEDDDDDLFEMPTNKRLRQESHLQHNRHSMIHQQPPSPPQKRYRIQPSTSDLETEEAEAGLGQDKRKGKFRQIAMESSHEQPEGSVESEDASFPAMNDDNRELGPFQLNKESVMAEPALSSPAPPVDVPSSPATMTSSQVIDVSRQNLRQMPLPPDSQKTFVVPTQRPHDDTVPPDTQATVVPSPRARRRARRAVSREPALQPLVAHNTRSHRLPQREFHQLDNKARSRPRKTQPPDLSPAPQLPLIRESGEQNVSTSVVANTSLREEVQVEAILQVPEENRQESQEGARDQDSTNESVSSEDDEAIRMLRNANKEMITQATRSKRRPSRDVGISPNPQILPYIDMSHAAAQATRSGLTRPVFQPSSDILNIGSDMDATPKARQTITQKAAKKTAARNPSVLSNDSDSEYVESGTRSDSSFPVESTIAHVYKAAQSPFTPAHGTMANEHTRAETTKQNAENTLTRIRGDLLI